MSVLSQTCTTSFAGAGAVLHGIVLRGFDILFSPTLESPTSPPHDRTQWRLVRTITQSINKDALQAQDDVEMHVDEEFGDEPSHGLHQAQPQAPPGYYPLPPNFAERFEP